MAMVSYMQEEHQTRKWLPAGKEIQSERDVHCRYADDFRIFCRTKDVAERTKCAVTLWLKERAETGNFRKENKDSQREKSLF